jgi:hypothetical protein
MRAIARSILHEALTRALTDPGVGGGADPDAAIAAMFSGRPGLALKFDDVSKLFQNINGTGSVAATSDPVGYVTDISGNGNHAKAVANDTTRPLFAADVPRAIFDGSNDRLVTPSLNFTATDKISVVAHMTLLSDALSIPFETSDNAASNAGAFNLFRSFSGTDLTPLAYGSTLRYFSSPGYAAPATVVVTLLYDIAAVATVDQVKMRIGGVEVPVTGGTGTLGTGNFGNWPLNIGSRNGAYPANVSFRRLVVCGWALTPDELALLGG